MSDTDFDGEKLAKNMDMKEFAEVLNFAMKYNGPFVTRLAEMPCVKYIDPHIDLRTNSVFSITFRGFGNADRTFHNQNEERLNPVSLRDRCMAYLKGEIK